MRIINKKFLFVLALISLGFLFSPFPAHAVGPFGIIGIGIAVIGLGSLFGLVPGVGSIVGQIGTAFGKAIAAIIIGIFTGLLTIPAILLQWSVDPWFIKYGYTKGGVVEIGWPVVRDLANMLIVLVLVIIGLATALRLGEYQARKTLPILIGVALLINFTPVIMGVIVDFFNVIMNFFLEGFLGSAIISNNFSNMMGALTTKNAFDVTFWIELVFMGIFAILAGILFLLFALLFIMRRVAIWILVILSPIAFVAYILPATRGFFRYWWNQFFQWTIIGVFAAFFLWLSNHLIDLASRPNFTASVDIGGDIQEMMNALAPFLVAIIFLYIGFFVSLSTSAMGASGIIAGFQGFTKKAEAWARRQAWERGKRAAKERWQKSAAAERISRRLATAQAPEEVRVFGRKIPVVSQVAKWGAAASAAATRAVGRAGLAVREMGPIDVSREEEEAKKRSVEIKASHILSPEKTKTQRVATLLAAIEQGQLKALEKILPEERREAEIEKLGREALEIHPEVFKQFAKAYPQIAERVAEGFHIERRGAAGMVLTDEDRRRGYRTVVDKIMAEMKTEDIAKMAPSALMNVDIKEAIHEFWGGPQISAAARAFRRDFVDPFMQTAHSKGREWYETHNPKVLRYLRRTTAQEVGFTLPVSAGDMAPRVPRPGASLEERYTGFRRQLEELQRRPRLTGDETTRRDALIREVEDLRRAREEAIREEEERRPSARRRRPRGWLGPGVEEAPPVEISEEERRAAIERERRRRGWPGPGVE